MTESVYNISVPIFMKSVLFSLIIVITLSLAWWGFLSYGTTRGYSEYIAWWEYRRLHPELIASPSIIKLFDMWHTTSYASWTWLGLIQYIGDNVGGNRFLNFSHSILTQITYLHPYFTRPYEMDLIFAPLSSGENTTPQEKIANKQIAMNAMYLGKQWITQLCDAKKIENIKTQKMWEQLWNNATLKNPCASGMLPYYLAFTTYQMGDNRAKAAEYYKIASMNADAPKASRILGILALSAEGDYMASALNFALVGSTGYDIDPYSCRSIAENLTRDIIEKRKPDTVWINELQKIDRELKDTRDESNPISNSSDNCYDMTTRSIKTIYLSYISDLAKWTSAKNGADLIKIGKLKNIPTLSIHKWYSVREKNGIWEYQAK